MPEPQEQDPIAQARRMFRAVLAPWAADLLKLRGRGLDRPSFRRTLGPALRPRDGAGDVGGLRLAGTYGRARRRAA